MIWQAAPTGKRGGQPDFSDAAIQTYLTIKVLFAMALRQTTGFVESLLHRIILDWVVPNLSTLSRRQKTVKVNIPYRGSASPLHLLIDSTGIKAYPPSAEGCTMSHKATVWAIQQRGLKPATKIVLWFLCDRHNPDFGCFPTQMRLAGPTPVSFRPFESNTRHQGDRIWQ